MKPVNRSKQKNNYLLVGLVIFVSILYLSCHLNKVGFEDISSIIDALDHMTAHPLDIFPLNPEMLGSAVPIALIPSLLLYTEYLRRRALRPSVESGSAHWNEDLKGFLYAYAEIKIPALIRRINQIIGSLPVVGKLYKKNLQPKVERAFLTPDKTPQARNMILSNEIYLSMNGRKTFRNCNILVMGGSGTGKSRYIVKPNLLQANTSFVITDPSGELLETMGMYLKNQGYEIRVFNLVQMDHSNTYNPFHYIRDENGVLTMVNALIKNTTPKDSHSSDPFWEKAETNLLTACCFYLVSECNMEDRNFANVMKLLQCHSAEEGHENEDSTLDIMFNDLKARDPEHIAIRYYNVFKSAGSGKTAQSILISCQTRLQHFNLTAVKNLTSTDNIDLGSLGDNKVALFCTTSVTDTSYNFLISLLYTQLFETLYYHAETECKGMRLPIHVRFLLDEFANIGTIPDFSQKLATMRKYEISCTIIIQALSQLKAMYKDEWEVLVGNCDSTIFLGGSDATSLEYISKKLGKETIRSINNSRSYGRQGSYSMSYNTTGRELMQTDELSTMDNDNSIVFIRGLYPFFTPKYKLTKHPNYKKTGDANDSLKFYVKDVLQTGQNTPIQVSPTTAARIHHEAQIADTREAERQHRIYSRRIVRQTAQGHPTMEIKPLSEVLPYAGIPADQLTREELEMRQRADENLDLMDIVLPDKPEDRAEYTQALLKARLLNRRQQNLFGSFLAAEDVPSDSASEDATPDSADLEDEMEEPFF